MDGMEWFREQELDTLAHLEDEQRSRTGAFEEMAAQKQYANPLKKGDTVRIVGDVCQGLIGEVKVVDPEQENECFFGIQLDEIEGWIFFSADEIERVEAEPVCESCGGLGEVREYPTGLFSLPSWKWVPCPGCSVVNMAELPF